MEEEKESLEKVEELIALGELDGAQSMLNKINDKSAKKYYVQSRIYKERKWYGEQRKQLKKAVKAEPDNGQYKRELEELENSEEMQQYKSAMKALRKNERAQWLSACSDTCWC